MYKIKRVKASVFNCQNIHCRVSLCALSFIYILYRVQLTPAHLCLSPWPCTRTRWIRYISFTGSRNPRMGTRARLPPRIARASEPNKAAPEWFSANDEVGAARSGSLVYATIIFAIISDTRDATPIRSPFVDCRLSVAIVEPLALEIESCYGRAPRKKNELSRDCSRCNGNAWNFTMTENEKILHKT